MSKHIKNLSDAWARSVYGPFKTRIGLRVSIVDKVTDPAGITYFEMSDGVDRLPSGVAHNGATSTWPDNTDITEFNMLRKNKTVVSDGRLVHLQKAIKQAKKDLRRYVRHGYPVGSKIAIPRRGGIVLMEVVEHGPKVLKGVEVHTGKRIQINYELITGRYKHKERKS